ncbi:STAS domain-containing protein [Alteromonas lipolytica]|uniref:STAS domain-containing protein n=1 Tax=Alteromonas lipolytica TaxID=1856405 RepID=UPI003570CD8A
MNFGQFKNGVFNFDFSRVTRIDSAGLGALIMVRREIISKDVEICLVNLNADVYRLFSKTRMNKLFMLKR